MHVLTVTEPLSRGAYQLPVGSYLADNINAGELLARYPSTITANQAPNPAPLAARSTVTGLRLLVIRAGGFGDLLFLTPVFRALKERDPSVHIAVACFSDYAPTLANNPDVAEIVAYPVPLASVEQYDAVVMLENTVEDERNEHATDRYFREFGIDPQDVPDEAKRCSYHLTEKERAGALSMFPTKLDDKGRAVPRLGVQAVASSMCRTYPHDQLAEVCQMLHLKGWEIFFFGEPRTLQIQERERITNLSLRALDFRQSAAVLSTCDVVLAPDSSLAHLAGALDLPCIALYGPFPWKLRTAYHPKTIAIQGTGPCAPCFHHVRGRQHWPEGGPCVKSGRCDVLASIAPGRVAMKISALYKASLHIAEQRIAQSAD